MKFKAKVWTGPVIVKEIAQRMIDKGYGTVIPGTEHVYLSLEAESELNAREKLSMEVYRSKEIHNIVGPHIQLKELPNV